jgi:site-specific DNA-methyltransferase (adenine-specific)
MLLNEDCLVAMQKLIDDGVQVDSIVTDPPYHLQSIVDRFGKASVDDDTYTSEKVRNRSDGYSRLISTGFMGKEWDGGDIAFRKETWELALKLLKPGGHLLAFSASRNYHRMAVAVEDAGFEIRDQLMWLYGSGFPKSHNLGDGWGTALKPAHEPIVMARKFIEGTNKNNREKYGTGGINIDGCRVGLSEGDDPRLGGKGTWKTDKMAKDVYVGGYAGVDTGSSELGRFPANVMHDGSDVVKDIFPNSKLGSSKPHIVKSNIEKYEGWGNISNKNEMVGYGDEGSAARFFYCPKVSKSERGEDNTHPTVKPQELMKYLCRLVTPKGGTVLDPFMGSGSTGIAAKDEGFEFIGIEREKEYFEIAEKRINSASPLMEFM